MAVQGPGRAGQGRARQEVEEKAGAKGRARCAKARQRVQAVNARSLARGAGCDAEHPPHPPTPRPPLPPNSFSSLQTALHFPAGNLTPHPTMSSASTPHPWDGPQLGAQRVLAPPAFRRRPAALPRLSPEHPRPGSRQRTGRGTRHHGRGRTGAQQGDLQALRRDARRHPDTWPQLPWALELSLQGREE